jgi:hypothetical protein
MTSIDKALRSFELQRLNMVLEIVKALESIDNFSGQSTPAEGYAASDNRSSQSAAQTLAGLRQPTTSPDPMDSETIQSLLKNIITVNPGIAQTALSNAMLAASQQVPHTLPSDVAAQQGFAKEDAGQLAAAALPLDRVHHDGVMTPLEQVTGGGSRADLWEGRKGVETAQNGSSGTAKVDDQALSITKHAGNEAQSALLAGDASQAQTGIIASFVLNAAMLPGWPIPNQAAMAEFVAKTKISEEEMFKALKNLGANEELLEKLRKKKPQVGKKVLLYLAMFLTAVETVIDTVANELAALSGEEKNLKESREKANSRGHAGSRRHVYVE